MVTGVVPRERGCNRALTFSAAIIGISVNLSIHTGSKDSLGCTTHVEHTVDLKHAPVLPAERNVETRKGNGLFSP